jgi:hypothetical protein
MPRLPAGRYTPSIIRNAFGELFVNISEYLVGKSKDDLIREIIALSKNIPIVQEYYSNLLSNSEEILDKFKKLVKQEYFPARGFGDARAGIVRKILSDFKKISKSNHDLIDLLIYHVEQGVKYTNEYGDIDEKFYSSIESSFDSAMNLIKKDKSFQKYKKRCLKIINDTDGIGWGFHDCLADLYYSKFKTG